MKVAYNQFADKLDETEIEVDTVEAICGIRLEHKAGLANLQYLIKWEDFSWFETSWEPVSGLKDCLSLVSDFWTEMLRTDGFALKKERLELGYVPAKYKNSVKTQREIDIWNKNKK